MAKKKGAKKQEEKPKKDDDSIVARALKELTTGVILGSLKTIYENFLKTMQDYAYQTQQRVLDIFIVFIVFMVGIMTVFISIIFLINQYLQIGFGWSLFIVGAILVIISYMMKNKIERRD
jgi:hypothetical protein